MNPIAPFVAGLLTMGWAVAALFFARFWRQNGDRLFALFAAAFFLMCVQQALILPGETGILAYVLRLLAFLLILGGVVGKNVGGEGRSASRRSSSSSSS